MRHRFYIGCQSPPHNSSSSCLRETLPGTASTQSLHCVRTLDDFTLHAGQCISAKARLPGVFEGDRLTSTRAYYIEAVAAARRGGGPIAFRGGDQTGLTGFLSKARREGKVVEDRERGAIIGKVNRGRHWSEVSWRLEWGNEQRPPTLNVKFHVR